MASVATVVVHRPRGRQMAAGPVRLYRQCTGQQPLPRDAVLRPCGVRHHRELGHRRAWLHLPWAERCQPVCLRHGGRPVAAAEPVAVGRLQLERVRRRS
ncbi:hypothetical protein K4043_05900 [Stenotrophomonas sp. SRS1]|nr:hypothetical protein [Stenotrophomonas sp. SRS1]